LAVAGRVLIVEDEPVVRIACAARLAAEGYEVVTAANGRQALEQLQAGPLPDVILLDYAMPVMDGRAFREAQVSNPRWERIPVILVTAYLQRAFAARSLDVAAILEKPVVWDDLAALLQRFCPSTPAASR
jgi:CheY-like chemotaxis protein